MGLAHWDDVERRRAERGHIAGSWRDLGDAAESVHVGLKRIEIDPDRWSTPAHVEGAEEEIFYVLNGSGLSWQDGKTYEVRVGDCIVHRAAREAHTLKAGDDGLDVLAFGTRVLIQVAELPRAGVAWAGPTWVDAGAEPPPWDREVAAGEPETPAPVERPSNIVNLDDVEAQYDGRWRPLARSAKAIQTGLNHTALRGGESGAPPHCHSADEELFVVLEGSGTLELWPSPQRAETEERQEHELRAGHVVSRPSGSGIGHFLRAGDEGMTYLVYGTRDPNDVCYYPRSNKIYWRGLGLIARLEPLDYMDGEPEE